VTFVLLEIDTASVFEFQFVIQIPVKYTSNYFIDVSKYKIVLHFRTHLSE